MNSSSVVPGRTMALLCAALLLAPLAIVYCEPTNPAAMPCCQDGVSECHRPGMTQDCCKKTIGLDLKVASLRKTERSSKWIAVTVADRFTDAVEPLCPLDRGLILSESRTCPSPSPPSSAPLRI